MFALFLESYARTRPQVLLRCPISDTELKCLRWTQGEIGPGNQANPVNRAHVKKALVTNDSRLLTCEEALQSPLLASC